MAIVIQGRTQQIEILPLKINWKHDRFLTLAKRNRKAAKRFFRKALRSFHMQSPQTITVDKNAAYPPAIELQTEKKLSKAYQHQTNQVFEQHGRAGIGSSRSWYVRCLDSNLFTLLPVYLNGSNRCT